MCVCVCVFPVVTDAYRKRWVWLRLVEIGGFLSENRSVVRFGSVMCVGLHQ